MKGKRKVSRKGEWEAEELHRPKTNQKGAECDYTDEALALLNHLKPIMNLWRALMSALDTKFKPLKKPFPRVLNLNFLRAGQLQRGYSIVSNSSSSQHSLQ